MPRTARMPKTSRQPRQVSPNIDHEKALELYCQGLLDTQIAPYFEGVNSRDIFFWREVNELPTNNGIYDWQQEKCRQCEKGCKTAKGQKRACRMVAV